VALPDTIKLVPGTAIIWGETGASGVTHTLSLNNLAAGAARMGAYADLGASGFDDDYLLIIAIEPASAPTAGGAVDVYLPSTHSTSYWPNEVTGSDGAWPADSNEDEHALQISPPAGSLIVTNDDRLQVQSSRRWRPNGRYVAPVVDNNMSVGTKNETTATNNDSRIILVPLVATVVD
jgi:hypothetical protein